ncbi:hypothetical protein FXO38_20137 [Capsicum annuum]|nr:hypothetical protein FXO38_20137 [Capsicum annuum]
MTEIVEEVAEEVEKVAEEVEKKLPGDSKFKESLDSIENLAKGAVKYANQAQDIIHKVACGNKGKRYLNAKVMIHQPLETGKT